MRSFNIKELFDFYAQLNSDYIRMKEFKVDFDSTVGEEQEKRLNKIWKLIEEKIKYEEKK